MTKGELLKQKINYLRKQKLNIYTKKERMERASLTDRVIAEGNEKYGMDITAMRIKAEKLILQKG